MTEPEVAANVYTMASYKTMSLRMAFRDVRYDFQDMLVLLGPPDYQDFTEVPTQGVVVLCEWKFEKLKHLRKTEKMVARWFKEKGAGSGKSV